MANKKPSKTSLLKEEPNFIMVEFSYKRVILPYADGMKLIESLKNAELCDGYGDEFKVKPLTKDMLDFKVISQAQYLAGKMGHILKVNIDPDTMEEKHEE